MITEFTVLEPNQTTSNTYTTYHTEKGAVKRLNVQLRTKITLRKFLILSKVYVKFAHWALHVP